ncbi:replication-relaxation family protein [bacterium]|nr:replication-relaxation family protein [bacterium]
MTTSQIHTQHFPSIHRARKRLNQLWWAGFVHRVKIPPGLEFLSAEAVYSISRAGLRLLQAQGGHEFRWIVPKPPKRPGSLMFLSHTLLRNSFRIALENSVRQNSSVKLCDWKHDGSIAQSVLVPDIRTQALKKVVLKADAYFRLRKNGLEVEFYLEVDNGTMPLTRLVEKIMAYQIWRRALRNTDSERHRRVRILILVFSRKRAQNLLKRLTTPLLGDPYNSLCLIAFVPREELLFTSIVDGLVWNQSASGSQNSTALSHQLDE